MDASPSPAARPTAWEWVHVALLGASLTWTTLCLGGYRPETMVATVWLNGFLLASVLLAQALGHAPRPHPAGLLLLPFFAYAAVNAAWLTPVPWLGWRDWMLWAQAGTVFWAVLHGIRAGAARRALGGVLVALGVLAVALAAYQRWGDPEWLMLGRRQAPQFIGRSSGPFGIPNSLAALLLLLLPPTIAVALRREDSSPRRFGAALLAVIFTLGLLLTISRGAWLALALALAAWPLWAGGGGLARRLGVSLAVLAGLAAAGFGLYHASPGVRERIDHFVQDGGERTRPIMWRIAWSIFREHPTTGGGAGSYNVLLEKFRPENFADDAQWAHNEYLNTLSDYGAVGFLLWFGAIGTIAFRTVRARTGGDGQGTVPAGAVGIGLLAFALQLAVDFHFKIPALGMACATVAALAVTRRWPAAAPAGAVSRAGLAAAALGVFAGTALVVSPHFRAEAWRYGVRREIDASANAAPDAGREKALLETALPAARKAVELDPGNAQAWADLAYFTALRSRVEPGRNLELGRTAEEAARRALALAPVVAEFWLRLGLALDLQGRWGDAGAAYAEALRLAPNNANGWYYQAYHFSLRPSYRALALASIATCLRLDPSRQDAAALRQRLAAAP